MEPSPFLHPGFIVPVAVGIIGFVAWLIRLEGKVNLNTTALKRLDVRLDDTGKVLDGHRSNSNVHFSPQLAAEVEKRHDERYARMERTLSEINRKLDALAAEREIRGGLSK